MERYLNFISNLIILIPLAIISGPFFSDLIVSVSALFFLLYCLIKNQFKYFNNNFFKLFILFWIYIVGLSFFSENIIVSFKSAFPYIRFGIFVIFISFIIQNNKNFLERFSISLILVYCVILFDSYFQFFFNQNIIGLISPSKNRLSSFFGDEMIVGSFLSRLFPLVLFCILILSNKYNEKIKFLSIILLILSDIIIYLAGERTSFGILIIINVGFILLINQMKILRLVTFIFSILIIIFITNNSGPVKDRMITQTIKDFGIKEENYQMFSSVHQSHYETAFQMFKKNPVTGVGVKMFRYECANVQYARGNFNCTTHPHHTHLQILSETGIIGYFLLLTGLFFIIKRFILSININYFKKKNTKILDLQNCILIGVFANIFPLIPSGNFFNNWLSILYFLPIGFYFIKNKKYGI